jgi:aspartate--ammonia ligase
MMTTNTTTTTWYMPSDLLPPERNREANATHRLTRLELQRAMTDIKRFVEFRLEKDLHLTKHSSPLVFVAGTGVNDELDGTASKSPVHFTVPNEDIPRGLVTAKAVTPAMIVATDPCGVVDETITTTATATLTSTAGGTATPPQYSMECEVVQSLAKWKRIMLHRLKVPVNEGIYCDSTSIRKGYKGDVTHSVVADQWDFEIRITREQRTVEQLKHFVRILWNIITDAEDYILDKYPHILLEGHPTAKWRLPKEIVFLTCNDLYDMYPDLSIHDRETAAVNRFGAVFLIGMGWPLHDGSPAEEVRSPGYDDWNLNGDIIVRHPLTEYRHELSSMGIRVDEESLLKQLYHRGVLLHESTLGYQRAILEAKLPLSYGGGIGISRLLMQLLRTGHIGEVQVGVWHEAHYRQAALAGIDLIPDRIVEGAFW